MPISWTAGLLIVLGSYSDQVISPAFIGADMSAWLNFAFTGRNHRDLSIESEDYVSFLDSSRESPWTVESAWLNCKTGPSSMVLPHVVFRTNLVSLGFDSEFSLFLLVCACFEIAL